MKNNLPISKEAIHNLTDNQLNALKDAVRDVMIHTPLNHPQAEQIRDFYSAILKEDENRQPIQLIDLAVIIDNALRGVK